MRIIKASASHISIYTKNKGFCQVSILNDHALEDDDTYIVVSKAKGSEFATIHIKGDLADVAGLLELAELSIVDSGAGESVH